MFNKWYKVVSKNNKWYRDKEAETYFSLKLCCSCFSAAEKNSSISSELGMKRQTEVSILRREVIELLVLLLVVDPGVVIISGFLIKLHGVVSLVLLQPKEGSVHLAYNSSYSACFFSWNSIFLSQKSAKSVFQPAYNSSRTGPKHI
jgi:hypothetical protein